MIEAFKLSSEAISIATIAAYAALELLVFGKNSSFSTDGLAVASALCVAIGTPS